MLILVADELQLHVAVLFEFNCCLFHFLLRNLNGENVQSVTLDILKAIQASIADLDGRVDARMSVIEDLMRKQRCDMAGILVLMKGAAGQFDERVTDLERRVTTLEGKGETG